MGANLRLCYLIETGEMRPMVFGHKKNHFITATLGIAYTSPHIHVRQSAIPNYIMNITIDDDYDDNYSISEYT